MLSDGALVVGVILVACVFVVSRVVLVMSGFVVVVALVDGVFCAV